MAFWWVNHTQTFRQEVEGGYIWSPKANKDSSRNQTYINLTEVRPGDVVFSYASQHIRAVGIAEEVCSETSKPESFGKSGEQWASAGWLVPIRWERLPVPFKPKDYLSSIVPLLPKKYAPIQSSGVGNQKFYLSSIHDKLGFLLLSIAENSETGLKDTISVIRRNVAEGIEQQAILREAISHTERQQLIWARCGQGVFRSNVEKVEKSCRLTGVTDGAVLIASHIKPWRLSNNSEKLDGNNGLLMSPHVDKLFDGGWISFADDGRVLVAGSKVRALMTAWGLQPDIRVGAFNAEQQAYLDYHRRHILKILDSN